MTDYILNHHYPRTQSNPTFIIFHVATHSFRDKAHHLKIKWELERANIKYVEVGLWIGNVYHMALAVEHKYNMIIKSYLWEHNIQYYFEMRSDEEMVSIRKIEQGNVELEYENLQGMNILTLDPLKEGYNITLEIYEPDGSANILSSVPNRTKERTNLINSYFGFGMEN